MKRYQDERQPSPITALRHHQSYSLELLDATAVVTQEDRDIVISDAVHRLARAIQQRFDLPDIKAIFAQDPERKTAIRVSLQLIDEGANDAEIRKLLRLDLAAFDEFVERERPKMLKREPTKKPQ